MKTLRQKLDDLVTEADLLELVRTLAKLYGWDFYHTYSSRRSTAGLPDCLLVRPPRLIWAELKTERGRASDAQRHWMDQLAKSGQDVRLWRPSDVDEIETTLR